MNKNESTLITDQEVAWEAAQAQKPFFEIARTAQAVGQFGIAAEMKQLGEREVLYVEEAAQAEGRRKDKLAEERSLRQLFRESDEDILTRTDFKLSNPQDGIDAWERLFLFLEQNPEMPMRFVEYHQGKHALMGDIKAAAELVTDPTISSILQESAQAFELARQ